MPDLKTIVRTVLNDYALPWFGLHGLPHWARVLDNGVQLAAVTHAKVEVVVLFALLHDARRTSELSDPGHGRRAAELARSLRGTLLELSNADFELLAAACAQHADGLTKADVTIATCWDADRLDLGRLGIEPDPRRLCTPAAQRAEFRAWAHGRARAQVLPEIIARDWGLALPGREMTA